MISLRGQLLHCYVFTVPILACFVGLHSASRATGSIFSLAEVQTDTERHKTDTQIRLSTNQHWVSGLHCIV